MVTEVIEAALTYSNLIGMQLSIVPVLDGLQTRFADKSSPGMTNYEDLVQYLLQLKASRARDGRLRAEAEASEAKQHDFHAKMEARRARLATAEAENNNNIRRYAQSVVVRRC